MPDADVLFTVVIAAQRVGSAPCEWTESPGGIDPIVVGQQHRRRQPLRDRQSGPRLPRQIRNLAGRIIDRDSPIDLCMGREPPPVAGLRIERLQVHRVSIPSERVAVTNPPFGVPLRSRPGCNLDCVSQFVGFGLAVESFAGGNSARLSIGYPAAYVRLVAGQHARQNARTVAGCECRHMDCELTTGVECQAAILSVRVTSERTGSRSASPWLRARLSTA